MASSLNLLSEDQFLCPICLDMFTQPVSTPCGHNFCLSCLQSYWTNQAVCQCPVCKDTFERRPNLKVNTFISGLALQFMALQATDARICSPDQPKVRSGSAVLCDICGDTQQEAVKSCLECLTSYCGVHLEPHRKVTRLKSHTLVDPLARLQDSICKKHNRLLALFCRNDKVLMCDACASPHHASHDVVPVPRAYTEMRDLLGDTEAKVQRLIQERQQKVRAVRESVKQSKMETRDMVANSVQDSAALVAEVQKSQTQLVNALEEKQKAAEEQADGLVGSMERELAELQRTAATLGELRRTEDQLHFLQSFPDPSLLPRAVDLSAFSLNRALELQHLKKSASSSVSRLRTLLSRMCTEVTRFSLSNHVTLKYVQQYEVSVLLDPSTAHPLLTLSDDLKQVRYSMGSALWGNQNQSLNPNTFTEHLAVLGQRGFSARRFYFEVFVSQKTEWCLGVATASVQRTGALVRTPHSGLWAIWFLEDRFETFSSPGVTVYLGRVERVGVFVDYDGGQISFYDAQTATLVYSFTECVFLEELYPYLNPCDNEYGSNLEPMVIVPVSRA